MKQKEVMRKITLLQYLAELYGYSEESAKRLVDGNIVRTVKGKKFAAWGKPLPEFIESLAAPYGKNDSHEIHCIEAELLFPEPKKYADFIQLRDEGKSVKAACNVLCGKECSSKTNAGFVQGPLFSSVMGGLVSIACVFPVFNSQKTKENAQLPQNTHVLAIQNAHARNR